MSGKIRLAVVFLSLIVTIGCVPAPPEQQTNIIPVPPPAAEIPVANLPLDLREWNWTDRGGSGSCVHASLVYHLRWQGQLEKAEHWRKKYAGGETATSIQRYCKSEGVPFACTERADPAFLEWATRTRRGAIIWFFTSHCVHFCGFANVDGVEYAILCDNNRVENYIRVERGEFLRRWKSYGGFALSTLYSPLPPPLFPAYESQQL